MNSWIASRVGDYMPIASGVNKLAGYMGYFIPDSVTPKHPFLDYKEIAMMDRQLETLFNNTFNNSTSLGINESQISSFLDKASAMTLDMGNKTVRFDDLYGSPAEMIEKAKANVAACPI